MRGNDVKTATPQICVHSLEFWKYCWNLVLYTNQKKELMSTPSTNPSTQENEATSHINERHQGYIMNSEQMHVITLGYESLEESCNRMEVDVGNEIVQQQSTLQYQEVTDKMEGMEDEEKFEEFNERTRKESPHTNEVKDKEKKSNQFMDINDEQVQYYRKEELREEFAQNNEAQDKQQMLEHYIVTNSQQKDDNRTKGSSVELDNSNEVEYKGQMLKQSTRTNENQKNGNRTANTEEELSPINESESRQQMLDHHMDTNNEQNNDNRTEESRVELIHTNEAENKKQSLEQNVDTIEYQNEECRTEILRELSSHTKDGEDMRQMPVHSMDTDVDQNNNYRAEFKPIGKEDFNEKYRDATDQIAILQDQLNAMENEENTKIKKLEKFLERKKKKINKLKQKISILQQDLHNKDEQLTMQLSNEQHIHDKNLALEKEIEKVKKDAMNIQEKLNKKIGDQEQLLRKNEDEHNKLEADNKKLHYSIRTHFDLFYDKQNEVTVLEKKLKEVENNNSNLKTAIEKLELIKKEMQIKINEANLQEKVLNDNILKLKKKEDEHVLYIKNLETQKEEIQKQYQKELNERSKYEIELFKLREANVPLMKEIEEYRQTTQNLKENINPLQSIQHTSLRKNEDYNSLLADNKILKSKLESAEKELSNLKTLIMSLNVLSKETNERLSTTEESESEVPARQSKKLQKKRKRTVVEDSDVEINNTEKNKKYLKQNIVVSFSGFNDEHGKPVEGYYKRDKQYYESIVQKLGGTCLDDSGHFDPDPSVTHIIAAPGKRTGKIIKACLSGIWIMRKEWLIDSEKAGKFLPESEYGVRNIESPLKEKKIYMTKKFVASNENKRFEAFDTLKKLLFKDGGAEETDNIDNADVILFESKNEIKKLRNDKSIMFDWDGMLNFILTGQE